GIPRMAPHPRAPFDVGHQPGALAAEVDAGLRAQPEAARIARDGIDAELLAEGIEIDVARLAQGRPQVHPPVTAPQMAAERGVVEGGRAAAEAPVLRAHDALAEPGERHHDLEDRARRV